MITFPARLMVVSGILLGLTGCGGSGLPVPDDPPGNNPPGDSSPDDNAPPPNDDGDDTLTLEECVTEEWLLNNESWRLMLQPLAAESGANVESVTGEFVLHLQNNGNYTATYTGWTVTTQQTGGAAIIERNGTDAGFWDISRDRIGLVEFTQGSTIVGYIDAGGQRIDLPSVGSTESGSLEAFDVLCGPDDLLVTIETGTVLFTLNP